MEESNVQSNQNFSNLKIRRKLSNLINHLNANWFTTQKVFYRGAQLKSFSLEKLDYFCSDNALVEALVKVFEILTRLALGSNVWYLVFIDWL